MVGVTRVVTGTAALLLGAWLCGASAAALPSPSGTKPSPWKPYDEAADPHADISAALARAAAEDKDVLLTFGANWCPDCRVLSATMAQAPLAQQIDARYVVVKIDVGNWDKNLDVVKAWGDPIAKGIPSIVVADPKGSVLYTTRAGELANARRMGLTAVSQFFASLPERAR
jgi:thiol:disulfide interchange protein